MLKPIKNYWGILKQTVMEFSDDNALKLSASLSFFTVFAIAPMLFIVISLAGIFYGKDAIQGRLFGEIRNLIGDSAALQVQQMIANTHIQDNSIMGATIGVVVLILAATGVFTEIQDSINYIWSLKAKPQKGWLKYIINRVISFSLIVGLGFTLVVSLVINALMELLSHRITSLFSHVTFYIAYGVNIIFIFSAITLFFAIVFKVLPDAVIHWKDAFKGSFFTTILFMIGKFLIGFYLGHSKTSATYGAAASLVIILLWIYYTSVILYFGAEYTKVYTLHRGYGIKPNSNAVYILKQERKEMPVNDVY